MLYFFVSSFISMFSLSNIIFQILIYLCVSAIVSDLITKPRFQRNLQICLFNQTWTIIVYLSLVRILKHKFTFESIPKKILFHLTLYLYLMCFFFISFSFLTFLDKISPKWSLPHYLKINHSSSARTFMTKKKKSSKMKILYPPKKNVTRSGGRVLEAQWNCADPS